jgi:hypothetical protein
MDVTAAPDPGDLFSEISIAKKAGGYTWLNDVTNELVPLMADLFSDVDTVITHAEFWKYTPQTFDAEYISTFNIAVPGTVVAAGVAAHMEIYTFRTFEGGIMKVVHMESVNAQEAPLTYSDLSLDQQAFVDWFTDDLTAVVLGRDTSYPVVFLRLLPGESETLFKKRFRP